MTPFQQLRVWSRRAPVLHRAMAGGAALLVVALLGWLLVPVDRDDDSVSTVAGPQVDVAAGGEQQPGEQQPAEEQGGEVTAGADVSTGTTVAGGAGGSEAGATGGGSDASTSACPEAVAGQGVTNDEIQLAVTIITIAGAYGNSLLNVPTPDEQRAYWKIVLDKINASGGAACRKLVARYYDVNPIDANDTQAKCLAMAADKPFIVIDTGALSGGLGSPDCAAVQRIPLISNYLGSDQLAKYYPYFMLPGDLSENVTRNGVFALKQDGTLSAEKGFNKLGVIDYSCKKHLVDGMKRALAEAGIPGSQIVHYDMGCPPGGQYTPADQQQAVLTFRNAGATHVTYAGVNGNAFGDFTKTAQQQNYKPRYLVLDSALPPGSTMDAANFDGAIGVPGGRYGEETTPGFVPSGGTASCNAIFAAAGKPPVYQQGVGYGGVVCHYLFLLKLLFDRLPRLQREALAPNMRLIGKYDGAFSAGPSDFGAAPAGSARGAGFWRITTFRASCKCWQVTDPNWRPSFR